MKKLIISLALLGYIWTMFWLRASHSPYWVVVPLYFTFIWAGVVWRMVKKL